MLYVTIAALESASVVSTLMYDHCAHFVLFGSLCDKFWPSTRIEFEQPAFGPLHSPEYRIFWVGRCVRQAARHQIRSSRRLMDMKEIARSACTNELVYQELSLVG